MTDHPLLTTPSPTGVTHCCLTTCDWTIQHPVMQRAPGLGAIFGMPDEALEATHQHQQLKRMEADIERHLQTHSMLEWATAVMSLREMQMKIWNRGVEAMNASDRADWMIALCEIVELSSPL